MKIKPSSILLLVAAIFALALWIRGFWFTEVFSLHRQNASNRMALLQVRENIPLGATYADTLTAYWRHRSDDLRLTSDDPALWLIRMPLEWGSSDWNLRLAFIDGKVTAVQVRTSDGPPPNGAPEDKRQ